MFIGERLRGTGGTVTHTTSSPRHGSLAAAQARLHMTISEYLHFVFPIPNDVGV